MIDNVDQRSQGLRRDQGPVPARPRRLHLLQANTASATIAAAAGQSARETAVRVAAGAIARKVLGDGVTIRGALVQIGTAADRPRQAGTGTRSSDNPFWCPDRQAAQRLGSAISTTCASAAARVGAVIEVVASGVPAGLGEPVYDKLDADLAKALMSINAVKGVEIGDGFATAATDRRGECRRDAHGKDGAPVFLSPTMPAASWAASPPARTSSCRFAVKPTSSILHTARSRRPLRQRDRDRAPRAATIPASASAPCRWARR